MENKTILGDAREVMSGFHENAFDSIVTDPPYGLCFMGKQWDYDVPGVDVWREALRVIKPGGYILCFAGTRTQHRMCCNIEDAGFEIRDMLAWIYGSGFPKSLDIGKAIDKKMGAVREEATISITAPATPEALQWDGFGTALKPALEPITLARKPISEKTIADNVLKHGTGGLNIKGCRVGTEEIKTNHYPGDMTSSHKSKSGNKYDSQNNQGRFPANLIHDGSPEVEAIFPETVSGDQVRKNNVRRGTNGIYGDGNPQDSYGYSDSGSASRFFASFPFDNLCPLCYCLLCKDSKEDVCKNINADTAEKNLKTILQIKENTVQENVIREPDLKLVHLVKYAGNLCDSCAMSIVRDLAEIKNLDSKSEGLQAIQGFIGNYKKCILILNLANFVEQMDSIDTTPTTQNLLKLFGYMLPAIKSYIQKIKKSVPERLKYQAKASKQDRDEGLYSERKSAGEVTGGRKEGSDGLNSPRAGAGRTSGMKNHHPTVKPTDLMRYLCRLITPPGGIILDPFMGSGSTGKGAILEGFYFIGIDNDPESVELAKARISWAENHYQGTLF